MEAHRRLDDPQGRNALRRGWCVGSEEFHREQLEQLEQIYGKAKFCLPGLGDCRKLCSCCRLLQSQGRNRVNGLPPRTGAWLARLDKWTQRVGLRPWNGCAAPIGIRYSLSFAAEVTTWRMLKI